MAQSTESPRIHSLRVAAAPDFGIIELRGGSPLVAQLLPSGAVYAFRHGPTLINQLLPGPAEDGLFRLLLRWFDGDGRIGGGISVAGAGASFAGRGKATAGWRLAPAPDLVCETELELHPALPAWRWRVRLCNESASSLSFDVLQAQDLGLGDETMVRNNEAYVSQYIDLLPVHDESLGWAVLARQNQPMADGKHPWLALACVNGAEAFCTDGSQFFGVDHRLTGEPAAVREPSLPSRRLQYEFALAGLQSRRVELLPGTSGEVVFVAWFETDHPDVSSPVDLKRFGPLRVGKWGDSARKPAAMRARAAPVPTLFTSSRWLHGDSPTAADWDEWFPGPRRHEERAPNGGLLAFFCGEHTHVVARDKEAAIARPHGHILRSGDARWFDAGHFGLTCYAAGVFAVQAYLGHPGFARLLSVFRNPLNVARASGQRVFVRREGAWEQLGVPSAFAMTPRDARWIYRVGGEVIALRVVSAQDIPAALLEIRVIAGPPCEFLVTHQLALGSTEFEHGGEIQVRAAAGWIGCHPSPASLVGRHQPGVGFAIASADPGKFATMGGDGCLYADGSDHRGPYVTLQSLPGDGCGVLILGTPHGPAALDAAVAAARAAFAGACVVSSSLARAPVRLRGHGDPGVARVDEVLPWFAHDAAIHFSAPHGLEQYNGGAWGVRDVSQGSVEWLLASGEFGVVRRILETVFAQQYTDGTWPQWFMLPPYRSIQQPQSHGDVCFWPVKALCDYIEASNDTAFLHAMLGYTDRRRFAPCAPLETILAHCDRVIAQCAARFLPDTVLVNYGDGDWDDTLQPADPEMRTRMVSAWTVALAFQVFRQLARVCTGVGEPERARQLDELCTRMRRDFVAHLMPSGVIAGFIVVEPGQRARSLLHPEDTSTGIRHRLLPLTRAILAELLTLEEARRHLRIIRDELRFPDGVRLMSEPPAYHGGRMRWFKRAETAANVGREIGLQYVHAHLRCAEALAKAGDAEGLWWALQVVNPVGLAAFLLQSAPRQANVYFSSSDADFADRPEATRRWSELRAGRVVVRGGWRLYSSGPGVFLRVVRSCLLGVRESFEDVVFDPVLPLSLDGLEAEATLCGRPVTLHYRVGENGFAPRALTINGVSCDISRREANPYRPGGVLIAQTRLQTLLRMTNNHIAIDL